MTKRELENVQVALKQELVACLSACTISIKGVSFHDQETGLWVKLTGVKVNGAGGLGWMASCWGGWCGHPHQPAVEPEGAACPHHIWIRLRHRRFAAQTV